MLMLWTYGPFFPVRANGEAHALPPSARKKGAITWTHFCKVPGISCRAARLLSTFPSDRTWGPQARNLHSATEPSARASSVCNILFCQTSKTRVDGRCASRIYHARMARRAQHLRCSLVREANEGTTSWISLEFLKCVSIL